MRSLCDNAQSLIAVAVCMAKVILLVRVRVRVLLLLFIIFCCTVRTVQQVPVLIVLVSPRVATQNTTQRQTSQGREGGARFVKNYPAIIYQRTELRIGSSTVLDCKAIPFHPPHSASNSRVQRRYAPLAIHCLYRYWYSVSWCVDIREKSIISIPSTKQGRPNPQERETDRYRAVQCSTTAATIE